MFLEYSKEKPMCIGSGSLTSGSTPRKMWEQLLKAYPESTGINPVFFFAVRIYYGR